MTKELTFTVTENDGGMKIIMESNGFSRMEACGILSHQLYELNKKFAEESKENENA